MSKNPLAIVILAAGKGTRMKSDKPKVMHELAGLPMINWLIRSAEELKPEKIVVVAGPGMPELEDAVRPHISVIQKEQNGTGGAVIAALPKLEGFDGDVLIILGDVPLLTSETMQALVDAREGAGLSVLGMDLDEPFGYGRLVLNEDGYLEKIVEEKDASEEEKENTLCNTGAFCVDGARLAGWLKAISNKNAKKEYYITNLPEIAAKDGAKAFVGITTDHEEVRGCNTRADLAALEQTLQSRLRIQFMEAGVSLLDADTVYFHHDTKIGKDVRIEPNVFFGPGVIVEDNVTIKSFCHFEGAKIGRGSMVGPFARLRPGAALEDDVRIGNFVEVKKSRIGARSKINHLAYVGDTEMGEDTNFSAGAITVNYDGFQKHQTIIGKGVMVGSNVNLVAPVKLDDGAFIAAGSTITEDVPADSLSMERGKAEVRQGWAATYRKMKENRKRKKAS